MRFREIVKKSSAIFLMLWISLLAGISNLRAEVSVTTGPEAGESTGTQFSAAMASLVGSSDEEFEKLSGDIEQIYGQYLGSVTAGYDEMSKFMQEGWLLSFRSADDDLVTDLAALPTNLAGMRPDQAMANQWMRSGATVSSSLSGQSQVLGHTHTALVATEITGNVIAISTGVGAGGVALKKVFLDQGGRQVAKLVLRGTAKAGAGLAVGFLSEQAMIKAGIKPEHAQLAMKGAELFFAWKMLKVARMASAARTGTQGAITNLGLRDTNAKLLSEIPTGEGMSGVYDHTLGRFVLRHSSNASPLPAGAVVQYGGHMDVRTSLGQAIGEDLAGAASGRLSGFSVVKEVDGLRFGWNSGQINPGSHGARGVPDALRNEIEAAVRSALGL